MKEHNKSEEGDWCIELIGLLSSAGLNKKSTKRQKELAAELIAIVIEKGFPFEYIDQVLCENKT
jgi:hypothetical protein